MEASSGKYSSYSSSEATLGVYHILTSGAIDLQVDATTDHPSLKSSIVPE